MKKIKENFKIIGILLFFLGIGIFFYVFGRGTYSVDYTFTREEMQDMVVSTGLNYFYNKEYVDFEQHSLDGVYSNPYDYKTFYWPNYKNSPEMVSRSNRFNIDCASFAMLVYLHSLGYDMSEYYNLFSRYFIENGVKKSSSSSIENYQKAYSNYGMGWWTASISNIGNVISSNNDRTGIEYKNDSTSNDSALVYYYRVKLVEGSDGWQYYLSGDDLETEKTKIRKSILSILEPGDVIVIRRKDIQTGEASGHTSIYLGDALSEGSHGFLNSTGTDFNTSVDDDGLMVIGQDEYGIRYDTWEDKFEETIFIESDTRVSYEFTVIRPINTFCDGNSCVVNSGTVQSANYKKAIDTNLENTITRDELSRLKIEQYQKNGTTTLTDYSSLNNGDNITYHLSLTNKSFFEYCTGGAPSYNTKSTCEEGGYTWTQTTDDKKVTYEDLTITAKVPSGSTYVECTGGCKYDSKENEISWTVDSISPKEEKKYTYTVKVNGDSDVVNEGMVITTSSGNELKLGELKTSINPTLSSVNEENFEKYIEKFSSYVDSGKIIYNAYSSGQNYKEDLDALSEDIEISPFGFIKMLYYNSLRIDIDMLGRDEIKAAIFDNATGNGYNVFFKKTESEVANLTSETYKNINKMLVPGMYGGRLLKGNDNLDRARFLNGYTLEYGDILVTYSGDASYINVYMFCGLSSNGSIQFVEYSKTSAGEYKMLRHDSNATYGKSGWRIFKEIFSKDLFVVLRPSRLYGTTVNYQTNGGTMDSTSYVAYNTYKNLVNPTRSGYTFSGWYSDSKFTNKVSNNSKLVSSNTHTLYAKWENDNTISVKYNMNGGMLGTTSSTSISYSGNNITKNGNVVVSTYNYGKTNIDLYDPDNSDYINIIKTGYKPKSGMEWNTKSDGSGTSFSDSGGVNSADLCDASEESCTVELFVNWEPIKYTISYTMNGGTLGTYKPESGTYNSRVTISNPSKTVTVTGNANGTGATVGSATSKAQTFAGWTSSSSAGLASSAKTGSSASSYSAWSGGATKNLYFKNLRQTSGTVTLTATWTPVAVTLPTVLKTGYSCNWNTKSDGSGTSYNSGASYTPSAKSSSSITMYAVCTAKNLDTKIEFDGNIQVDDENGNITRVFPQTTYKSFKEKMVTTEEVSISDSSGNSIEDSKILKTGDKIKISIGDNEYLYTVSVLGDLNSDGDVTIADVSILYKHCMGRTEMKKQYILSADVLEDNKITLGDVSRIYKYFMGRINSF